MLPAKASCTPIAFALSNVDLSVTLDVVRRTRLLVSLRAPISSAQPALRVMWLCTAFTFGRPERRGRLALGPRRNGAYQGHGAFGDRGVDRGGIETCVPDERGPVQWDGGPEQF